MTSRNSKKFGASGGTAALVLAAMFFLGSGLTARAQSADDRLEGAWRLQVTVRNCQTGEALRTFSALFTFAKGGTLGDDRRAASLLSHYRLRCLAAQRGQQLQRGVRVLHLQPHRSLDTDTQAHADHRDR